MSFRFIWKWARVAVWDVDAKMVVRTANWLLERRDGEGRFTRNPRALDTFAAYPGDHSDVLDCCPSGHDVRGHLAQRFGLSL